MPDPSEHGTEVYNLLREVEVENPDGSNVPHVTERVLMSDGTALERITLDDVTGAWEITSSGHNLGEDIDEWFRQHTRVGFTEV